jgi:hypothetical protein
MNHQGLSGYKDLIQLFISRAISASEFERSYLRMFKDDPTIRPEFEYEILNGLFGEVDAFSPGPALRLEGSLNEEQLRSAAESALKAL